MKYAATIPMDVWKEHHVVRLLQLLDLHEAYIGREIGKRGFKHFQCCINCAGDLERFNLEHCLGWHIEKCISWHDSINYCRKTGNYRYLGDSIEEREYHRVASRPLNIPQQNIERHIAVQNDRTISICVDTTGNTGKSTLGYTKCRTGEWFAIPRTEETPTRIMDYIAMHYNNEKVIWIDLPRTRKVDTRLAECLEDIKDGLIASSKYQGQVRFIRGVKVLVTTNHWVEKNAYQTLSKDRWDIFTAIPNAGSLQGNTTAPPLRGGEGVYFA